MFAALELLPRRTDPLSRLKEHLRPAAPRLQQVSVPGGAPFLCVQTALRKDGVPWDAVRETAGRCAGRMLLPKGIAPPTDSGIAAFVPRTLPLRLCFMTAARLLSESAVPPMGLSVGIEDPDAVLTDLIEHIVMCAAQIVICTKRPAAYVQTAQRLLNLYGAVLRVSTTPEILRPCAVRVSLDAENDAENTAKVWICPHRETMPHLSCCVITGRGVDAPQTLTALCPSGVDPDLFCCALYELCGVRDMATAGFRMLYHHGFEVSTYRATEAMRRALG